MDNYIVSARKYRPATFHTVIGQKALSQTLKASIQSHRLAHAYLFCGPRGVGKTTCARIFAKTINCEHLTADGEACNECESCKAFNEQRSLNIVELDAASNNGIEDIRSLVEQVRIPPQLGLYKVFIIDEVHMLTTAAFNGFLKTLEEPPAHAIFIMATTEKHKIIPTILSRCQIYDFQRITIQNIVEHLQYVAKNEGIKAEITALDVIAQKSDGAMRDALSMFDQIAAASEGNITYQSAIANLNMLDYDYYFKLVNAFLKGDVPQSLIIFKDIREHGFDASFFINGLAQHLRDILVSKDEVTLPLLQVSDVVAQQYKEQAKQCDTRFLYAAMDLCNKCDINYRTSNNKQFLVELTLIQICQLCNGENPNPSGPTTLKKISATTAPTTGNTTASGSASSQSPTGATNVYENTPPAPATKVADVPTSYPFEETPKNLAARLTVEVKPQKKPVKASSLKSFSLRGNVKKDDDEANAAQTVAQQVRNTPYTYEQLVQAWSDYILTIPSEHIVSNTMKTAIPTEIESGKYMCMVDNQMQVESMSAHMPRIIDFMQNKLDNNQFSIVIEENQGELAPRSWSQKEMLKDLFERVPDMGYFYKKFSLEID